MTRPLSVADLKRKKGRIPMTRMPPEGSTVRKYYDLFRLGEEVEIPTYQNSAILPRLKVGYAMDIERVSKRKYKLVGEWVGPIYMTAEEIVRDNTSIN